MTLDRRALLAATLAAPLALPTSHPVKPPEPNETIKLWPKGAPGPPATALEKTIEERSADPAQPDRAVHGIAKPWLAVCRPAVPNGAAVLVMPGGGYKWVVIDKEGYEIARWLAARGFTVFVLFYRLPGEGWAAGPDVALADAQRAMRLIRDRASAFALRPDRIAALGFSAGGHVCGDLATRFAASVYDPADPFDRLSTRPDCAGLIYPVQSMTLPVAHAGSREKLLGANPSPQLEQAHSTARNVTAAAPPCFLVHAEDDTSVPVENTLQFRAALKAAGVPVETHLFTVGGHGFGLRRAAGKPAAVWPQLFVNWARAQGLG